MDLGQRVLEDASFVERFELQDRIGEGGMGVVHRGRQKGLDRTVAIKFLSPDLLREPQYRDRFIAEARVAAGLIHQNVVAIFDYGIAAGVPYLVTEHVEGLTLTDVLTGEGALSVDICLRLATQVLSGLEALHLKGIVHRDLKPSNILITKGSHRVAKILDFGIAKQTGGAAGPRTATGIIMGTPAYLSPEQATNDQIGPPTDLYAFTLILHEMITGTHPFKAESTLEMVRRQVHDAPDLHSLLHPTVKAIMERGLAKRPADRPATATEYLQHLRILENVVVPTRSFFTGSAVAVTLASAVPGGGGVPTEPRIGGVAAALAKPVGPPSPGQTVPPPPAPYTGGNDVTAGHVVAPSGPSPVGSHRTDPPARGGGASIGFGLVAMVLIGLATLGLVRWSVQTRAASAIVTGDPVINGIHARAAEGKFEEAALALFVYARNQPQLCQVEEKDMAASELAQQIDMALLTVVESGLAHPPPIPDGFDPRATDVLEGHKMLGIAVAYLARLDMGSLSEVLWRFDQHGKHRSRSDSKSPDSGALHHPNALDVLSHLAWLHVARGVTDLMNCHYSFQVDRALHPIHPIGLGLEPLVADMARAAGLDVAAWMASAPTSGPPARYTDLQVPLARWPRLQDVVNSVRKRAIENWYQGPRLIPAAELRQGFLVCETATVAKIEADARRYRFGDRLDLDEVAKMVVATDPALAAELGALRSTIGSTVMVAHSPPVPVGPLVRLARALKVRRADLVERCAEDAGTQRTLPPSPAAP